ncbi:Epimerase family protein SA0724 [Streptococcus pneumoniae]|nr:Epimerase family protein SA0724 [Streptococcus pneumoniae]CJH85647.1 Epimerase family protein SA0724 [Streptococcus pneumoniae]
MLLPYQFYIGGTIGSGKQWLSWIHIDDVVRMMDFIIHKKEIDGPLNMTAPTPIRMKEFGENIATIMNKPHWLPVPSFIIQTLLGEMSILVLEGQRVLPIKAIEHGYQYTFPAIDHALQNILSHTM